jgi:LuxR family maltose regulon positive regulatory protein
LFVPQLSAIKLMMAEGKPEGLEKARASLERLDEKMAKIHRNMVRIQLLPLLALVCDAQDESSVAYDRLTEALLLAEPGGFVRTFVDLGPPMADLLRRWRHEGLVERSGSLAYVDRILAAFGREPDREQATPTASLSSPPILPAPAPSAQVSPAEQLIEPLTERELDVLALLAQRLTYKEIGAQLFISPGTVSQHAVRIYGKLQVNNRRQAVAKARALGILH